MNVSHLFLYPVKGASGIPLRSARLDAFGIEHDRRWMIVDSGGEFITQREHHELALLRTSIEQDALVIASTTAGAASVPLRQHEGPRVRVRVWGDVVEAIDTGDDAADVVSTHVGREARLVHMPDDVLRQADTTYARVGDRVAFADAFPLLLVGQGSVDEISRRVGQPLSVRRFRPNIVVAGTVPHAEDAWRRITIGAIPCDVVKPCARCVVTTVDPDTGAAGPEPLRTLAGYRRMERKTYFGQNVIHRATGIIAVGDAVTVEGVGTPRPYLGTL